MVNKLEATGNQRGAEMKRQPQAVVDVYRGRISPDMKMPEILWLVSFFNPTDLYIPLLPSNYL